MAALSLPLSRSLRRAAAALGMLALAAPAGAAGSGDPDWPCIQRRVDHLSLAVMWPLPLAEEPPELSPDLAALGAQLALRRLSEEEMRALVKEAAARHSDLTPEAWGEVFRIAFERIDRERARIIGGIVRYARNQARLAREIEDLRAEMRSLEAAAEPDFDRMDEVEEGLDWRTRLFADRDRALTYVCESPVLLEQHAYAVAQMILPHAR